MRTVRWLRRMVIPVAALYLVITANLPTLAGPTTVLAAGTYYVGVAGYSTGECGSGSARAPIPSGAYYPQQAV